MSGAKTLNILNVETGEMNVLVKAMTFAYPGSSVIFVTKDEHNGYVLNWTNIYTDEENNEHHEWFVQSLKADFLKCI